MFVRYPAIPGDGFGSLAECTQTQRGTNIPRKNEPRKLARKRVYFSLTAPEAKKVSLTGTCNEWDADARTLKLEGKGTWKTCMLLEPGSYQYRFLVDGTWQNDPESETVVNAHGTENCVRMVS